MILQWGTVPAKQVTNAGGGFTYNYPVAFLEKPYAVYVTMLGGDYTVTDKIISATAVNKNGFGAITNKPSATTTYPVAFFAIGE